MQSCNAAVLQLHLKWRRETLRRDPVVGAVIRVATRDFQLGGYGVPEGTNLLLPLRTLAETDPRWANSTGEERWLFVKSRRETAIFAWCGSMQLQPLVSLHGL
jgi:hypothetical protein